jgi:alkylation response protein AidB-like acyl-CoA dehydrogenase
METEIELKQEAKLNPAILQEIFDKEWTRIWIPKIYNGLDLPLQEGLCLLQSLAKRDGSLGWLVTLTSGANYFSRNIKPEIAQKIFTNPKVTFGGSGKIGGTAEKIGDKYLLNGYWTYGTGAPYLTHFSFNAQIVENGNPQTDASGNPIFRSFFLEADKVQYLETWNTFGLIATATHDFEVKNVWVTEENMFQYNHSYFDGIMDKIPFPVMADVTILVNHIGVAEHFLEESLNIRQTAVQKEFEAYLKGQIEQFYHIAEQIEEILTESDTLSAEFSEKVHAFGEDFVQNTAVYIAKIHPYLGMKASKFNEPINQIFRDYFTLTQHIHFRKVT